MATEGDRAAVFRTTKVRTKLKGDCSWLQHRNDTEARTVDSEEKPWIAELKASRLNGDPVESSPASPTKPTPPPPARSDTERAPSGFLIRGIFTKLDKPASSSTSNGFSGTTPFTKKPSESYKKIAPYTVRSPSENQEDQLSLEEQEKRTEAASNVLKKSAVRQRSYVLSAAKKYENQEPANTSPVDTGLSFVAKRVEITDEDESADTPEPTGTPLLSHVLPVTPVAAAPEPKPRRLVNASVKTAVDVAVNEPVASKVKEAVPEPVKEEPPSVSDAEKDPFEGMKPGCTKVATPLPELILECVPAVCAEPEPDHSDVSEQAVAALIELGPESPTPASPTPASPTPVSPTPTSPTPASPTPASPVLPLIVLESAAPLSPTPVSPTPGSPAPVSAVIEITVKTEPEPEPEQEHKPESKPEQEPKETPEPEAEQIPGPEPELKPEPEAEPDKIPEAEAEAEAEAETEPSPKPSSSVDTLTALSDTLISVDTSSISFKDDEPALAEEEGHSADSRTSEDGVEQDPAPEPSNCVLITDNLLSLSDGPEESAAPVPPSPGRWSQDLLSGLDSDSNPEKTSGTLDLLANDVIVISTEAHSHSTQQEEEKQADETAEETQSSSAETVTITTKTVIITDKSEEDSADPWSSHVTTTGSKSSSADPFDPYPIGTTSPNSSSDRLQHLSDISINSAPPASMENKDPSPETNMSSTVLESLADDVIPITTDTTSTQRSWARAWEISTPQQADTEESREAEPENAAEDQKTLVMFERKSTENDSPWDRWTSPTVYTITTGEEGEEEEGEESPEDTQTQNVTTVRETHSEPEPAMDRYETYSGAAPEDDQRVRTPEPETKKAIVYVKEYVNATELSLHNVADSVDGRSDNLTSSSASYSYSSPSTYSSGSLSSTCTYCGELVGNDAKISIEHLNINCHPACFQCGVCSKPMGDLLYSMFLHGGKVHCESCYSKAFD